MGVVNDGYVSRKASTKAGSDYNMLLLAHLSLLHPHHPLSSLLASLLVQKKKKKEEKEEKER